MAWAVWTLIAVASVCNRQASKRMLPVNAADNYKAVKLVAVSTISLTFVTILLLFHLAKFT